MNIPITRPYLGEEERRAVAAPLETGWVVQGPRVREFEQAVSAMTGAPIALATTSCTTALHLSLAALGIGPGDEVIVPSFTFVATANVVEYQGARPVFVDIDLATFNLDVAQVERRITPRTRAVIPVHLFGLSADMAPLMELARRHNLRVVEDAACALGTTYHGQHVGTFGDTGCLSFHARKIITTGEGGMVLASDADLGRRMEAMRSHGGVVSDLERHQKGAFALPDHPMLGYNYRMTDMQGAVGVEQMKKLDYILARRRDLACRYDDALGEVPGVATPHVPQGYTHTYQSYVLLVTEDAQVPRDDLAVRLQAKGISTRQGTHAVHLLGYYRQKYNLKPQDCPRAWQAHCQSLALPLFPAMTDEEQAYVIDSLRGMLV
ncbi:MAG: DegT/DnrJ/EryC1/StrS family aminotransferase [Chloroflexi bacterium]|nr:DegT/DnrJ/EryC1/StrS family aminotransferase [Chloroflexota bacterium]